MNNVNNDIKYQYKIYGLKILSQIRIPELVVSNECDHKKYDVIISYGIVPKEIISPKIDGKIIKASKNELYFHIKNVAHYYVSNGNRIVVEPESNCDKNELKVYLLGTALGMLLNQRNIVAIHGGSIVINEQSIIITGHTGAGKSTLTSAFRNEGYKFLADDVSALGRDKSEGIIVHPTYPQAKLCRDAMERMGYNPNNFKITDPSRDKYAIPLNKSFLDCPVSLYGIYEINIGDVNSVEVTEVLGAEKLGLILRNIYRIEISRYLGLEANYLKQCLEIAQMIHVYKIKRPREGFTVDDQIKIIKSTLQMEKENSYLVGGCK